VDYAALSARVDDVVAEPHVRDLLSDLLDAVYVLTSKYEEWDSMHSACVALREDRDAAEERARTAEATSAKWREDWHHSDRLRLAAEAEVKALGERIALAILALPVPPKEGVASSYYRGTIDGYRAALDATARIARETT
jgi:hypothetical protein